MAKKIITILEALRPKDWIKNIFIFAGAVFAEKLLLPGILAKVSVGFLLFSFGAGVVYLFNDFVDMQRDRLHPQKAKRPIPAGRLKKKEVIFIAVVILGFVIPWSFSLYTGFGLWILAYLGLNVLYTLKLKHLVIIDVLSIAAGYVIRVMAGCSLVSVTPSNWLIICTIAITLFLSLCKRRQEQILVTNTGKSGRQVLYDYSFGLLDRLIIVMTVATLGSYSLYTFSQETVAKFGTRKLILTTPFVLYGVFRYLHIIYQKDAGDNPIDTFLADRALTINVLLWVLAVLFIIYGGSN